jgi:hypothetical protein
MSAIDLRAPMSCANLITTRPLAKLHVYREEIAAEVKNALLG